MAPSCVGSGMTDIYRDPTDGATARRVDLLRRRRRREAEKPAVIEPPDAIALRELARLRAAALRRAACRKKREQRAEAPAAKKARAAEPKSSEPKPKAPEPKPKAKPPAPAKKKEFKRRKPKEGGSDKGPRPKKSERRVIEEKLAEEESERAALAAVKLGVDIIQITNLTPLPGTRMYERYKAEGRLFAQNYPADWERYTFVETVYHPKNMTGIGSLVPVGELLAAHLQQARRAHLEDGHSKWAAAATRELITLLRDDYPTLMGVLGALGDSLDK